MTLLDVIDLDEILTVNSMWEIFFWAIGESGRGFGLEVMRKSKFNKKWQKNKKTKMIEYDGC